MIITSVTYSKQSGTFFDMDYYVHKHIPMVKTLLTPHGLQDLRLLRGAETIDGGSPTFAMTALLTLESAERFRTAMGEYGKQILDDITNFTDMRPTIQINEPVDL